jgi:hypothetical protein
MTIDEKKERELHCVRLFKQAFNQFPSGDLLPDETPDCIVRAAERRIGIEVTRLFRDVKLQARESNLDRIVQLAKSLYIADGGPPVLVRVFPSHQHEFPSKSITELAERVMDTVRQNIPAEGETLEEEYVYTNREYFPECINTIRVTRISGVKRNQWSAPKAHFILPGSSDLLQANLDAKESKYVPCRGKADEVWLLCVTDTERLATYIPFCEETFTRQYRTRFDRVFVLQYGCVVRELIVR